MEILLPGVSPEFSIVLNVLIWLYLFTTIAKFIVHCAQDIELEWPNIIAQVTISLILSVFWLPFAIAHWCRNQQA